jgi:KDO2-lipid IV(A) lauroyltransferase
MWDNLGRVVAEYPHLRKICVFEPGGPVETHGFEHVDRAVGAGRRMIFFSGHIANWEIGMLAGVQYGISVAQIYRAANNPLMDRMIARLRSDRGQFIPKGAVGARRAIRGLRRGTHLALLADQKMNDGIPVPFFGRPAMTAPALAVLALRFDCDVLPLRVERLDGARFRVTVFPPLPLARGSVSTCASWRIPVVVGYVAARFRGDEAGCGARHVDQRPSGIGLSARRKAIAGSAAVTAASSSTSAAPAS